MASRKSRKTIGIIWLSHLSEPALSSAYVASCGGSLSLDLQGHTPYDPALIRIHLGAVDKDLVTRGSPPELFHLITQILMAMGMEIRKKAEYKYQCIRPKRRREPGTLTSRGERVGFTCCFIDD